MKKAALGLWLALCALPSASAQNSLVIANVTVIDGTDHAPRTAANILVENGTITAITSGNIHAPANAIVVNGTGKFLIPGLWNNDLHAVSFANARTALPDLLSHGITTVRDMGAPLEDVLRLRMEITSGAIVGPRLFVAGPLLEGPVPMRMPLIAGLFNDRQARDEVATLKRRQVDYVEVDTSLTPRLYRTVANEARHQGLPLVGHIPAEVSARDVVKARQVDIEHLGGRFLNVLIACSRDEAYFNRINSNTYAELLVAAKEKHPADEPQFRASFDNKLLETFDENKAQHLYHLYAKDEIAQTPTLYVLQTLWDTNREGDKLTDEDISAGKRIFAKDMEVIAQMRKAGVTILAGTDGPYNQGGEALQSELELLVRAGLTPLQAIQASSRDAARAMGVSATVGTVEVGKTADLVLLNADPLKNISNIRTIEAVVLHGHLLPKIDLAPPLKR